MAVELPTSALPKARLDGLAATTPVVPRPEMDTVCGLLVSESAKFNVAVRVPVAVGPKTMFAVQFAPAVRVAPQVLLKTEKSAGFAPVNVMLPMLISNALVFVSVTVFWPPLDPTATAAQVTLEGEVVAACMLFPGKTTHPAATVQTTRAVSLANLETCVPVRRRAVRCSSIRVRDRSSRVSPSLRARPDNRMILPRVVITQIDRRTRRGNHLSAFFSNIDCRIHG